jgi:hypothetical protein
MIFILTTLTIYLIMSATPGESGITYATPEKARQITAIILSLYWYRKQC